MHYVQCSLLGYKHAFRLIYIQTCKKSSCLKELAPGDGYQTCNNEHPCKKKKYQTNKNQYIRTNQQKHKTDMFSHESITHQNQK